MMMGWLGGLLHTDEVLPDYRERGNPSSTFEDEVVTVLDFVVHRAVQIEDGIGVEEQAGHDGEADGARADAPATGLQQGPTAAKKPKVLGRQWFERIGEVWKEWHDMSLE